MQILKTIRGAVKDQLFLLAQSPQPTTSLEGIPWQPRRTRRDYEIWSEIISLQDITALWASLMHINITSSYKTGSDRSSSACVYIHVCVCFSRLLISRFLFRYESVHGLQKHHGSPSSAAAAEDRNSQLHNPKLPPLLTQQESDSKQKLPEINALHSAVTKRSYREIIN